MMKLDREMFSYLEEMNLSVDSDRLLAAVETDRDTLLVSDKNWMFEWDMENVESCRMLELMLERCDTVFMRKDEIRNTPWAKLLFPDKDKYFYCEEDEEDEEDDDTIGDKVSFTNSENVTMMYCREYVNAFFELIDKPIFEMYMLSDDSGCLIVYDGNKRVGATIPCR